MVDGYSIEEARKLVAPATPKPSEYTTEELIAFLLRLNWIKRVKRGRNKGKLVAVAGFIEQGFVSDFIINSSNLILGCFLTNKGIKTLKKKYQKKVDFNKFVQKRPRRTCKRYPVRIY